MGTMNFSIPDDLKDKFNEVFKDENKSAVVTELMRRAVEERQQAGQRSAKAPEWQKGLTFAERTQHIRDACVRTYDDDQIRKLREDGRP